MPTLFIQHHTVYRVMEEIGLSHKSKRKFNAITKADRNARKSDDLLKTCAPVKLYQGPGINY